MISRIMTGQVTNSFTRKVSSRSDWPLLPIEVTQSSDKEDAFLESWVQQK